MNNEELGGAFGKLRSAQITEFAGSDHRPLTARIWKPPGAVQANLVLLHGIVSHGGWYARSGSYLSEHGIAVHFLDRRGSGLNMLERGDVDHWSTWIADVSEYLRTLDSAPSLLGGISWGGKLAVAVAESCHDQIEGLALLCPGIYSYQEPGPLRRWALTAARIPPLGKRYVTIPLEDPALFTNSPRERRYVRNDPFTLRKVTLRFALQDQTLTRTCRTVLPRLATPLLLVLAGDDRIVQNRRLRELFATCCATNKKLLEYPAAAHTMDFEEDPGSYFSDLRDWVLSIAQRDSVRR